MQRPRRWQVGEITPVVSQARNTVESVRRHGEHAAVPLSLPLSLAVSLAGAGTEQPAFEGVTASWPAVAPWLIRDCADASSRPQTRARSQCQSASARRWT